MELKGKMVKNVDTVEYRRTPQMLMTTSGCKCPICGKHWVLHGKGQGFVKAGAWKHISACYIKQLASRGLQIGKWDEEVGANILEPLGTKYVEPQSQKMDVDAQDWPWN